MKLQIPFYIVIATLFIFFSCEKKKSKYLIGVSQCSADEWRDKMNMEMQNEAQLSQKIDLIVMSSNDNTKKQISDIKSLVEQNVDLLILTPNEIEPITPIIEGIYDKGIPIILVDRKINSDKFTAFIGADNYQIGTQVGHYVVNLLNKKGSVAEIKGLIGSSPAIERHRGFYDVIKDYPDIKIVFEGNASWLKDEGAVQMANALKSEHLDLVFAQNDRMAKGAYMEAEKEGRAKDIYFLGIDGLPGSGEGIDMVIQNKLEATFLYPTGGDKTIQLALNILEGGHFNKNNILATSVIDKTNAKILQLQTDQIVELQDKMLVLNKRVNSQWEKYIVQRNVMYLISFLAFLFCTLLAFLIRAYRTKINLNRKLHKTNLKINRQKNELEEHQLQLLTLSKQLEEATHAKLVFYTDISHDFRTPLTLISGSVDMLMQMPGMENEGQNWLKMIKKNVAILLRLVNQIIEFRKIETNNIKLNLSSNDLDTCLDNWNLLFLQLGQKNNINFQYKREDNCNFIFQFDLEKMERIYFNLLSNAFKFTNKGGDISVVLSKTQHEGKLFAEILISNTGNRLSETEMKNIFERFYRVDSHVAGSGIGLALVKALIDLHQGSIDVTSKNNLTIFDIKIPLIIADSHIIQEGVIRHSEFSDFAEFSDIELYPNDNENSSTLNNTYTLLIIDDNEEIRSYIRSIFKNTYHIIEASDGEEGLHLAYDNNIDIIISDVMMPKIDGIELCTRIKEDIRVCHIPIVLLTAYSLDEHRIKGFESGADAYITKPFDAKILKIRIQKMLENREKVKRYLTDTLSVNKPEILQINTLDNQLILKFRNYILDRISDTNLNVEDISNEFGFSRAQFYRKMKAITNQGPNEFIRTIRLTKSMEILQSGKTVSEVAYEVGFTSPAYFAKCFKEFFDKNPSEIKTSIP